MQEDNKKIKLIGPSWIHDSTILAIETYKHNVKVIIKPLQGRPFYIEFCEATQVIENKPLGMMLYCLNEYEGDSNSRHFVFENWEEDDSKLEIIAKSIIIENAPVITKLRPTKNSRYVFLPWHASCGAIRAPWQKNHSLL